MQSKPNAEFYNSFGKEYLPGLIGININQVSENAVTAELTVKKSHLAPNGYLHAATVIALADTACGYGCLAHLPAGAENFTTIELKSNFLGTAREGTLACVASPVHQGSTTQIWDAVVTDRARERKVALFRCTQLIIWPKRTG